MQVKGLKAKLQAQTWTKATEPMSPVVHVQTASRGKFPQDDGISHPS